MTLLHAYDDMLILVFNGSYIDFYYFIDLLITHWHRGGRSFLLSSQFVELWNQ